MSTGRRNFNFVNALEADQQYCRELSKKTGKPMAEVLSLLVSAHQADPAEANVIDVAVIDNLKATNAELAEKLAQLSNTNNDFSGKLAEANEQIARLTDQLSQVPQPPAYVFSPDSWLYKQMHRAIAFLIRKGKLNKADKDLPQQFTAKALTYFIKNEYPEVLK